MRGLTKENADEGDLRRQLPAPLRQEYYRCNVNFANWDGPLVLPPPLHRHSFMVTSSSIQTLTSRGLFSGLPSEDPYTYIAKLRSVCNSCVGRLNMDIDIIGLWVFPLSVSGEAIFWFIELPYNSIYTWE